MILIITGSVKSKKIKDKIPALADSIGAETFLSSTECEVQPPVSVLDKNGHSPITTFHI